MGFRFSIEHASLVGWMTRRDFPGPPGPWPPGLLPGFFEMWDHWRMRMPYHDREVHEERWKAPRARADTIRDFLTEAPGLLITRRPRYRGELEAAAKASLERLASTPSADGPPGMLHSDDVAHILAPVRDLFVVPYYFLICDQRDHGEAIRNTPDFTLWLQCSANLSSEASRDILDPFPAIPTMLAQLSDGPVTLCWDWAGRAQSIPSERVPPEELMRMVTKMPPRAMWERLQEVSQGEPPGSGFHILQLSDLHFGTKATRESLGYVEQHLQQRITEMRRGGRAVQPVITGDLMDNPTKASLEEFNAFRNRLANAAGTHIVAVPGNHDMRKKGLLWKSLEPLTELEWSSVVESEACQAVFFCFDSSKDAKLARGKITNKQLTDVSTSVHERLGRGRLEDRIRIALIHHHPFSTTEDEQDVVPYLRIREERFMRMENSDEFVQWCGKLDVPLILHGHKHKPRFVSREVVLHEGNLRLVRAIGCGSTFGADGYPRAYNWITWQPRTRSWSITYYSDPGDGSGFVPKRLVGGHSTLPEG